MEEKPISKIPVSKLFRVVAILAVCLAFVTLHQLASDSLKIISLATIQPLLNAVGLNSVLLVPSSTPAPAFLDKFWQFEPTQRLYDNRTDIPTKAVLIWNDFYGRADWPDHFGNNHGPYVELEMYNSMKRCYFTRNRTYYSDKASAIVFHGILHGYAGDLNFNDMPKNRLSFQRWVFYVLESTFYTFNNDDHWQKISSLQFNWTMGYAKAADIYDPYGYVRPSKQKPDLEALANKISGFAKSFSSRPKDAVWLVGHCDTQSKREVFVSKLKSLGITVDIFGRCGTGRPDDALNANGTKAFYSSYRFVLGLENSLCEDYITEKGFRAFYVNFVAGTIPIVYSGANYSDFFVDGSYINMRSFKNITDMVRLMKRLSNSDETSPELLAYYDWHKTVNPAYERGFELRPTSDLYTDDYAKRTGWRNLCKHLWDEDDGTIEVPPVNCTTSSYVKDLRTQVGKCTPPDLSPLGPV